MPSAIIRLTATNGIPARSRIASYLEVYALMRPSLLNRASRFMCPLTGRRQPAVGHTRFDFHATNSATRLDLSCDNVFERDGTTRSAALYSVVKLVKVVWRLNGTTPYRPWVKKS